MEVGERRRATTKLMHTDTMAKGDHVPQKVQDLFPMVETIPLQPPPALDLYDDMNIC